MAKNACNCIFAKAYYHGEKHLKKKIPENDG